MKVNDPNTNGVNSTGLDRTGLGATQRVQQTRDRAGAGAAKSAGTETGDSVEISSLSAQLGALSVAPPQTAKLDKLNGDFQTGQLQIDSLAVSQGLIAESLSLGSRSLSR